MKKIFLLIVGLILVSGSAWAKGLALVEATKLIQKPQLEVYCEDGDGDTYNRIYVFQGDEDRTEFAIVGLRVGEDVRNRRGDVLVAEKATRDQNLSLRAVQGTVLSYFEVAKYKAPSVAVTIYQEQLLGGGLKCMVDSKVEELNRRLQGAMSGALPRY